MREQIRFGAYKSLCAPALLAAVFPLPVVLAVILVIVLIVVLVIILILAVLLLVFVLVVHWIFLRNSLFADSRCISLPASSGFILIFKKERGSQSGAYRSSNSTGCGL